MSAAPRTPRDERRRRLGQNFLRAEAADRFVSGAGVEPGELVVDIGAGSGALTRALAERRAEVIAVEVDPTWASRLQALARQHVGEGRVRVIHRDFLSVRLPRRPFRVIGCLPFGSTTAILSKLFESPEIPLQRADLILQWEVARKRAATPPTTLLSTTWAPWWEFRLGPRVPARDFRPVPRVDGGVLVITRRQPTLLPVSMSRPFAGFVRERWPFTPEHDAGSITPP